MENTLRPPIVSYIVTHNLTVSGATMSTIVTSPVAIITLNGVPSGHYYVSVAAVNIVGQGQSAQGSFTGINEFNSYINNCYYHYSCSGSTIIYSN